MLDFGYYNMDCFDGFKMIDDGSIDMILCDLPYGNINGMILKGWNTETTEWDERLDKKRLFIEYERILKRNGVIVLFSQEPYTSELRTHNATNLEFSYPLIWVKNHFANPLNCKKAPVSYFEDISVFHKRYDTELSNPNRKYFDKVFEFIGISSGKEINKILGHRKAEHCFYINTSQFSLCTEDTYNELIKTFGIDKMNGFKTFSELEETERDFNQRIFNIPKGENFVGNVLNFKKDYNAIHPTQKPVALLECLILLYTNKGALVLDNCGGSCSTGVACHNTGRKFIGFEKSKERYKSGKERLDREMAQMNLFDFI